MAGILVLTMLWPFESGAASTTDEPTSAPHVAAGIYFEENRGQFADHVAFVVRGAGMQVFLTDRGAGFVLREPEEPPSRPVGPGARPSADAGGDAWAVLLDFGASAPPVGQEPLPGRSHHLVGSEDRWVQGARHFARVVHPGMGPGIDVVWHASPAGLKFDVVVQPGAELERFRIEVQGAEAVLLEEGRIVVETPLGRLTKDAPVTYQDTPAGRRGVESRHVLDGRHVSYAVGEHDPRLPLVIDPLVHATYLGGSGSESGDAIAVDASGSAYVTGEVQSTDFPTTPGAFRPLAPGDTDAYVTKLDPSGGGLVYATYLGGSEWDYPYDIQVDAGGDVVVVGETRSLDFPVTAGAPQPLLPGPSAAFVTRLDPSGGALGWSTFLGGADADSASALDLDASGGVYVTGQTLSSDFPTTSGAFQATLPGGYGDAFVVKYTPSGDVVYATFLGGAADSDAAWGIAVDGSGHVYVGGDTGSADFPVQPGAFQPTLPGSRSGFVAQVAPGGGALVYATFLGGIDEDMVWDLAVDGSGQAVVVGDTSSSGFPVSAGALQSTLQGPMDAFVAKLDAAGSGVVYSTFLGGSDLDRAWDVATDSQGRAFVAGETMSSDFPATWGAHQATLPGSTVAAAFFVVDGDGDALVHATYLGGTMPDRAYGVAVQGDCQVHLTGRTRSLDFPATPGALATSHQGGFMDAFVAKLSPCPPPPEVGLSWSPEPVCHNQPVSFVLSVASGPPLAKAEWDLDGAWRSDAPPVVSFTHVYTTPGDRNVDLQVRDVVGGQASVAATVPVVNCPPVLEPVADVAVYEQQRMLIQLLADDPNGDLLVFSASGLPAGATLTASGWLEWVPGKGRAGVYSVPVRVTDAYGAWDTQLVQITVVAAERQARAPEPGDADRDGIPDLHDACPARPDATGACLPPALASDGPQEAPPDPCDLGELKAQGVSAVWSGDHVVVAWRHASVCPVDRYLVWNGTSHLVAVVPVGAQAGHVAVDMDPWPMPHRYFVQAMLAGERERFMADRAVPSELVGAPEAGQDGPDDQGPAPAAPPAAATPPADGRLVPVAFGAGGVLVALALLGGVLWRLGRLPWIVRMATRTADGGSLGHPLRARIAALVAAEPGIHLMEIQRRIGKGNGTTRHHVRVLVRAGALVPRRAGRYVCYYPPEVQDPRLQILGGLLRSEVARRLLQEVSARPGLAVAQLARRVGADPTTVRYHLRRFHEAGLTRWRSEPGGAKVHPAGWASEALGKLGLR